MNEEAFSSRILRKKHVLTSPTGPEPITLTTLLHLFHFIHVTISLINYSHLFFRHIEPCSYGGTCVAHKNLVYDLAHHRVNWYLEGHGFDSRSKLKKSFFSLIIRLGNYYYYYYFSTCLYTMPLRVLTELVFSLKLVI